MSAETAPRSSTRPEVAAGLAWHALSPEKALRALDSSPGGLSKTEALQRLAVHGANELPAAAGLSWPRLLARQFRSLLVIILLVACVLAMGLGEPIEAAAIFVIVMLSVALGFFQEYRAERAMEALRGVAAPQARVLRDGRQTDRPARELVPGDLVLLVAGDRVPADARLVESANLRVNEAPLTGESLPVEKDSLRQEAPEAPVADRRNMVFSGTTVSYGRGRAVITGTGPATAIGSISSLLASVEKRATPLQKNLDRLGRVLAIVALVIVALISVAGFLRGTDLLSLFLFAMALAVAVVPEALPAVVTVSLAIGVQRMARRNALVRHLPAVETLGSTSVICSDKTGTLTRNEMTVTEIHAGGRGLEVTGRGYGCVGEVRSRDTGGVPWNLVRAVLTTATLASDAHLQPGPAGVEIRGDPTEAALLVAAGKAGLDPSALRRENPRVLEVPFDAATRRMATLHQGNGGPLAHLKGAPEAVLPVCARILDEEATRPLDVAERRELMATAEDMAARALRVMALACRPGDQLDPDSGDWVFLGLVGMLDPARATAASAVKRCRNAGVRPVMITGDHPQTARAIGRELGILAGGEVMNGAELSALSPAELAERVADIDVYSRVSPEQKLRVIEAWQQRGAVVAMTGDGVNDAPALRRADVGVAMGLAGTDVSREAADMILTDDRFESIVGAVEEGRGIFSNIRKYLMYLLSSNVGEIGLVGAATLLGLPMPLSAVQILYVNLATDGLPALALAVDPPSEDLMEHLPRDPDAGVFDPASVALMLTGGLWSTGVNLGLFVWALQSGSSLAEAMTMTFACLVLIQFFKAYSFRSERASVLRRPLANRWLNRAVAWELTLLVVIVQWPVLQSVFGTRPLTVEEWLILVIAAFSVIPILELGKWLIRRREPGPARVAG